MTAYLGGASPVLHLRDSCLWWGAGTERGWVDVRGGGYVQRVLAGCRYRACPTPGQAALLARTSGWAPVVFNDALRTRREAHTAGEKVGDTQVQRRVVTLAKTTPARQWLGGVAPVALVAAAPLPPTTSDVGVDPGLASLAVLSTGEVIDSPGQLRRRARAAARAQRAPAAKAKGRRGVPGRQVGLLSSIVRLPRAAWTHVTGWPTAWLVIAK